MVTKTTKIRRLAKLRQRKDQPTWQAIEEAVKEYKRNKRAKRAQRLRTKAELKRRSQHRRRNARR